jgi:hypothetical protein
MARGACAEEDAARFFMRIMMDQTTKTMKPMINNAKMMMAQRVEYSFFLAELTWLVCETGPAGEKGKGIARGDVDGVGDLGVVVGGVSTMYLDKIDRLLFSKRLKSSGRK